MESGYLPDLPGTSRMTFHAAPGAVPPKSHEDPSVKMARNRFRNVLKHLVQESFMQDDESDSDDDTRLYNGPGGPASKRLKLGTEPAKSLPAFVMKLFDRGVDLAQFNENTPLYPICRAWIQNKPHLSRKRDTDLDSDDLIDYREDSEEVYLLPPPEPLPYDEYGDVISYRIPPPLPRNEDSFDINYDEETAPSPPLLFQDHYDRWTMVRNRWKEASRYNETRYGASFGVIKSIYERNRPEDPVSKNGAGPVIVSTASNAPVAVSTAGGPGIEADDGMGGTVTVKTQVEEVEESGMEEDDHMQFIH